MRERWIVVTFAIGTLLSCSSVSVEHHDLLAEWLLTNAIILHEGEVHEIDADQLSSNAAITFDRNGQFLGFTPCNGFNGVYRVNADAEMRVEEFWSTSAGCAPKGTPDDLVDRAVLELHVQRTISFNASGNGLTLAFGGHEFHFARRD